MPIENGENLRKLILSRCILWGLAKLIMHPKTASAINMGGSGGEASTGSKIIMDIFYHSH
jgi:hypothetical protein